MEPFSGKEKIALGVIALILLGIFIQVATHINLFGLGLSGTEPCAVADINRSGNLIDLPGVTLTASSRNGRRQSVEKLRDRDIRSYWHVALDQVGKPASVVVDFGEGNARTVRSLAAFPREDLPLQFLRRARLDGSNDGVDWEPVSEIVLPDAPPQAGWWKWDFANDRSYRYYRLEILQGHEDGSRYNFYSMAELALFE
ncbi:MAG TPA: discoidin domain-containing protein [bacterium]|nr:discoidin domain-containing protein [bacterium]HPJ72844.1 discoidin domain-containing protein [bacterium]HPQ65175.1 discoidin domain-containing protein [bacterium]